MSYYTERHGMRTPIEKTYVISVKMYALLFSYCEKYYNNLAWKYPEQCGDGCGCCGLDYQKFSDDLSFEIPTLFRDDAGRISVPSIRRNLFEGVERTDEYDQFALFDYIEFFANNCKDVTDGAFHSYYGHYHLTCSESKNIFSNFQAGINDIFTKTGLLYRLSNNLEIERIVENDTLTSEIEAKVSAVQEKGTRELLLEAFSLHRKPYPGCARDATEKIWDALERLKTYYFPSLDKKKSAEKIVEDISAGQAAYQTIFNDEFLTLTKIGNNFRIRHHETDKVEIPDDRYYDYFFNRCLSLIALAIQYLK
jgi:hypothetical protein